MYLGLFALVMLASPGYADSPFAWFNYVFASWLPKQPPNTVVPVFRKEEWWQEQHKQLVARAHQGNVGLLFLGDSITEGMDHATDTIVELWGKYRPANFGIGGDTTQLLLWRLQNGELDGLKPQVTVLLIGTNNLANSSDEEIVQGIAANVHEIRKRLPKTKVVILGILPRGHEANDPFRARIRTINAAVSHIADGKHVYFADVGDSLLEKDGTISQEVMSDYLHPTPEGYKRMFLALKPKLDPLF